MTTKKQNTSVSQPDRRKFLIGATTVVGAVGAAGLLIPFVASMNPSARARSLGAPVKFDISKLEPGQQVTFIWQGKPIWVLHRTPEMLTRLTDAGLLERLSDPNSQVKSQQPDYITNTDRATRSAYFVTIALCTHLGCIPNFRPELAPADLGSDWLGGYFCPCHGSLFDFAGRVFKNVPAPTNLVIPPYQYLTDTVIEVGTSPPT